MLEYFLHSYKSIAAVCRFMVIKDLPLRYIRMGVSTFIYMEMCGYTIYHRERVRPPSAQFHIYYWNDFRPFNNRILTYYEFETIYPYFIT